MKVGVELRQLTLAASGGIVQLVRGVLGAASRLYPEHEFVLLHTAANRGLIDESPGNVRGLTLPFSRFFEEVDRIADEGGIDVLFHTFPMEAPGHLPLDRQLFLVPDLLHEVFPEFFTREVLRVRRSAFNLALARGGAIGTLTEYTRKTIVDHEWTYCRDIFLMPPALREWPRDGSSAELTSRERFLIPTGEYFVYPANLWPHKNHRRILRAFEVFLRRTQRRMSLVLTGHPDGWVEVQKEFPGLPVFHLGFVHERVLRALLEGAQALIFFSLYEGFGIPLLEAFDAETPVICSNASGLPEVGGDAILACEPTDVDAMSTLMEHVVTDRKLRTRLQAAGRRRLRCYSWERSARSLVAACERVARRRADGQAAVVRVEQTHQPLVSIVTPSLNQGHFLRATIDSVLSQTYANIEYIVIDGGSTDASVEILRSYGSRIDWVSERDRGQTDALNKGLGRAGGGIFGCLNSDDVLMPGAVEKAVEHFRQHPECDLVYGKANYIDEDGQVTGEYRTAEYSFERVMEDCCICQPAAFWRARIARKIGRFDETLDFAMDYEYWLRIDRGGGRIQHIHDILACSRRYAATKTLSHRREIYDEICRICSKHGGYVHFNYFLGRWHHLVMERRDGWASRLRWVPSGWYALAWLHHKWFHGGYKAVGDAVAAQLMSRAERLPGGERAVGVAYRVRRWLRHRASRVGVGRPKPKAPSPADLR